MKTYDVNLEFIKTLQKITKAKAETNYGNNKTVYVKVSDEIWMSMKLEEDGDIKFSNDMNLYVENQYDEDKVIVSRHQCVIDFFKSKGINAKVVPCARLIDVQGKTVYTTSCPLHLLSFAKDAYILNVQNVGALEFDNVTLQDIISHKYQVRHYVIESTRVNEWSNVID